MNPPLKQPSVRTLLHWFRRDLRISDNTALHEAYTSADRLALLFVWDDERLGSASSSPAQTAFLYQSLESLRRNLESLGHTLTVRCGAPETVVPAVAAEVGASQVLANRDYEPDSLRRDHRVTEALAAAGVGFVARKDSVAWEGREVLTAAGAPYTVFTPYARAWKARRSPAPVPRLGPAKSRWPAVGQASIPKGPGELRLPAVLDLPPGGEHAGLARLRDFLEQAVWAYAENRDYPALDGGVSGLSPHLRLGTVGIRTVLAQLAAARPDTDGAGSERGRQIWLNELIWREFYCQILANFPEVAARAFRPEYDQIQWPGPDAHFDAWAAGRTGYPLVDAAMRCLNATGRMHNRLRMVTAMFLVKDLLVSWRRGERYFMSKLLDGDLAANNGGWQWSAGVGTDAAPYFRIFNPVSQGRRFDPEARFVRRWAPELASAPLRCVHEPWLDPEQLARADYPPPIVNHAVQRERCLALFRSARGAKDSDAGEGLGGPPAAADP